MDWQTPLALSIVAFAVWRLARRWTAPASGCGGGCGTCSQPASEGGTFVSLDVLSTAAGKLERPDLRSDD